MYTPQNRAKEVKHLNTECETCNGYEPEWTIALADAEDESFWPILRELMGDDGLVFWCISCSAQTTGVVYHAREGVSAADVDHALFAFGP
jgi:hypothetical protein